MWSIYQKVICYIYLCVYRDVFGDMTYSIATDGSPLYKSRRDLLNAGKRILFENQKDIWLQTEGSVTPVVISPVLWTHQFDENSFQEFPNCTSMY
jgi:hypothetical protein